MCPTRSLCACLCRSFGWAPVTHVGPKLVAVPGWANSANHGSKACPSVALLIGQRHGPCESGPCQARDVSRRLRVGSRAADRITPPTRGASKATI
jgi:hypothetical protein